MLEMAVSSVLHHRLLLAAGGNLAARAVEILPASAERAAPILPAWSCWVALAIAAVVLTGILFHLLKLHRRTALATATLRREVESRQETEAALRASEERLRAITDQAPYPVLAYTDTGRILHANPAACQFLEAQPEALIGATLETLNLPRSSLDRLRQACRGEADPAKPVPIGPCLLATRRGGIRSVDITCSRIDWPGTPDRVALYWIIDRTEQEKAEEALRASEGRYRAIVEDQTEIVARLLPDLTVSFINQAGADFFGRSPEAVIGRTLADFLPRDDLLKASRRMTLVSPDNPVFTLEESVLGSDGLRHWLRVTLRAILADGARAADGAHVAEYQAVAWDVTAQKAAREALHESEERFRNVFQNAVMGIYRTTPDGRILLANPALVQMLGFNSFEELSRRNLEKEGFEPGYSRDTFRQALNSRGEVRGLESAWRRRDGIHIHVRENARLVRDSEGRPLYYEGTVEDITGHKEAEQALREALGRLEAIYNTNFLSIVFTRQDDGRIFECNPGFERLLERDRDDILGKTVADVGLITPEERLRHRERLARTDPLHGQELAFKTRLGRERTVVYSLGTIKIGGRPCLMSVMIDATDLRKAEKARLESEARLQLVLENSPDIITLHDSQGRFLYCGGPNRYGIPPDGMEGKTLHDLLPSPEAETICDQIRQVAVSRRGMTVENAVTLAGESLWFSDHMFPIFDPEGRLLHVARVSRNITQRKRVEAERERYADRMRLLHHTERAILNAESPREIAFAALEQLRDMVSFDHASVTLTDFQVREARLLATDSGARAKAAADSLPLSPRDLFDLLPLSRLGASAGRKVDQVSTLPESHPLRRFFEEQGLGSFIYLPLRSPAGLVGVLALARKDTVRFHPDEVEIAREVCDALAVAISHAQLRQQARNDAETRAALLREVNHRVKNNLLSILGMLETERTRATGDPERTVEQAITDLTGRIRGLATVHEMLSASGWTHINAGELARRIVESGSGGRLGKDRLQIRVADGDLRLSSDEAHYLALVLSELVTNSMKHAWPEHETGNLSVEMKERNGAFEMRFRDDGPGFPQDVLAGGPETGNVGLRLIRFVVERNLRGNLQFENNSGAVARIRYHRCGGNEETAQE